MWRLKYDGVYGLMFCRPVVVTCPGTLDFVETDLFATFDIAEPDLFVIVFLSV